VLDERTDGMEQHVDELISEIRASARPRLFVISGPSGVGKDTVIDRLRERLTDFYFAVTVTTRERRPGEIDGVHYFFMERGDFERRLEEGEFLESAQVYGNWYGVPRSGVRSALRSGRSAIVKVDVQGAATIRSLASEAILVFLMPPSIEELTRRLFHRKTDGPSVMLRRVSTASQEMNAVHDFDYVVVNEEGRLDKAIDDIIAIITAEQLRVTQQGIEL
jgi:guanylate kinase